MTDRPQRPLTEADARYGAAQSRRLLVDAISALDAFADAVTVVGAHAVHVWVQEAWGPIDMETTRDGDVALNPVFVAPDPKLLAVLDSTGVEPATPDRPGIYGYVTEAGLPLAERTTVDLIVPEAYAGPGRRAARVPGQKSATSRALGLELAVWDRHRKTLTTIDEPVVGVDAYVASPAALLVAKAHKVSERLAEVAKKPQRLRPKDSGDVALLMMVSDGADVAAAMTKRCEAHPEIREAVATAAVRLVEMYRADGGAPRQQMADALAARFDDAEVWDAADEWLRAFQGSTEWSALAAD
jgi:hypothetical protein